MTQRIGNIIIIEPEAEEKCELCGDIAELRPYGPHGERICYKCGMKNEELTDAMMRHVLFDGPKPLVI
jgi:hypothetical protein